MENLGDETPAERITRQTEESLKALKRDAIDFLQIHFPRPNVPPEVILEVLNKFVIAGKVRYVGACNYSSWRQAAAIHVARASGLPEFVSSQNHYNLLKRFPELELLRFCAAYEIGFLPYFPLAAGLLTGKYRPGEAPPPGSRGAAGSQHLIVRERRATRQLSSSSMHGHGHGHGHGHEHAITVSRNLRSPGYYRALSCPA